MKISQMDLLPEFHSLWYDPNFQFVWNNTIRCAVYMIRQLFIKQKKRIEHEKVVDYTDRFAAYSYISGM